MAILKKCWLAKARDIGCLRNMHTFLMEEGLGQCMIQYVGGLSFLCEWPSIEIATKILEENRSTINHWVSDVKIWDENLVAKGRLAWVSFEGVPVQTWCKESLKNIASSFDKVLEVDGPYSHI